MNNKSIAILLVDDNADIGVMVKSIFLVYQRKRGCMPLDIVFAKSAEVGVAEVKKRRFDLILMDYQMPVHDGIWATGQIKKIAPETPIVFLSAYTARQDIAEARRAGAVAYIAKTVFSQMPVVRCLIDRDWAELERYADNREVWLLQTVSSVNNEQQIVISEKVSIR